jgi:transcriptional regulator with XRE-family HTH domain
VIHTWFFERTLLRGAAAQQGHTIMSELFKQLRAVRKSRRLKQEEVAQRAGISREAYLRAESGQADPRMSTFVSACNALGLDVFMVPRHLSPEITAFLQANDAIPDENAGRRGSSQPAALARDSGASAPPATEAGAAAGGAGGSGGGAESSSPPLNKV